MRVHFPAEIKAPCLLPEVTYDAQEFWNRGFVEKSFLEARERKTVYEKTIDEQQDNVCDSKQLIEPCWPRHLAGQASAMALGGEWNNSDHCSYQEAVPWCSSFPL